MSANIGLLFIISAGFICFVVDLLSIDDRKIQGRN
jgi:hypothetical protein